MKEQFDVWRYNFPVKGEHPVVIISPPSRASHAKFVNVLFCTSQRQSRQPHPFEVMLDSADGMDWETLCDCSILWAIESDKLFGKPDMCAKTGASQFDGWFGTFIGCPLSISWGSAKKPQPLPAFSLQPLFYA